MWRTPEGNTTFTGPYALMLARGIQAMLNDIDDALEYDAVHKLGHRAFDCLTPEQKTWTLHRVAYGLLDPKTPVCHHTAFLEAAIACIFRQLESEVDAEICYAAEFADELEADDNRDHAFYWRNTLLVPYNVVEMEFPDDLRDDNPLTAESDNMDDWRGTLEVLECQIFWDADYDMLEFNDMEPDEATALRAWLTIDDEYYSTIPEDPKHPAAKKLLKEIEKLCNRVIRREEKALRREPSA